MRAPRPRPPILVTGALLLLALFGFALAEDAFFHTDDGCPVEIHCLACRWARAAVPVETITAALSPMLDVVGEIVVPEAAVYGHLAPPLAPSRGPPLA